MNSNNTLEAIRSLENHVFPVTVGKEYSSMLFTPDAILFCSKRFDTAEAFKKTFDEVNEKTLTFTQTKKVPYDVITGFRHQNGSDKMHIQYEGMKIFMPGEIELDNGETDIHNIFTYLEKIQRYHRSDEQLSSTKAILPNLGYVALSLVVTWFLFGLASGERKASDGVRRRGKAELINDFAEMLGPSGVLLVGLAITAVLGWFLWKKYNNPPVETRLER